MSTLPEKHVVQYVCIFVCVCVVVVVGVKVQPLLNAV